MSNFWYYYKRRIKLIGLALMVVLLVVAGYFVYQHYVGKPPLPPDYVAGFDDDDIDSGKVGESDERDITPLPSPSESAPSVGDINVDDPASAVDKDKGANEQSNVTDVRWERVGGQNLASLTPFIDWSDGEITEDELDHMYRVIERLSFDKKSDSNINIICSAPTVEEMSNFSTPILYYAKDGVLTINVKLTVQYLDREKEKDIFQAVKLQYNLATIEVVD